MPFPDEFCDTLSASGGFAMGTFARANSFGGYDDAGIPLGNETVVRPFIVQQDLGALVENIDGELSLCGLTEFPRQDAVNIVLARGQYSLALAMSWRRPGTPHENTVVSMTACGSGIDLSSTPR